MKDVEDGAARQEENKKSTRFMDMGKEDMLDVTEEDAGKE